MGKKFNFPFILLSMANSNIPNISVPRWDGCGGGLSLCSSRYKLSFCPFEQRGWRRATKQIYDSEFPRLNSAYSGKSIQKLDFPLFHLPLSFFVCGIVRETRREEEIVTISLQARRYKISPSPPHITFFLPIFFHSISFFILFFVGNGLFRRFLYFFLAKKKELRMRVRDLVVGSRAVEGTGETTQEIDNLHKARSI